MRRSTRFSTSSVKVRTVPWISQLSGTTLVASPVWLIVTEITAVSIGRLLRVTIVWKACTIWQATGTGSSPRCGSAAWLPLPRIVILNSFEPAITGPLFSANCPTRMPGQLWMPKIASIGNFSNRPSRIISRAPPPPSSAGWNTRYTVPSKLRCFAKCRAAASSIAVWPSWPQACILPGWVLACAKWLCSVSGSASMSARSPTARLDVPFFTMPTTPVLPRPRCTGMPQSVSALAMTSAVRSSWKHSSGWAWMSRRMVVMAAASARIDSINCMLGLRDGGRQRPMLRRRLRTVAAQATRADPGAGARYDARHTPCRYRVDLRAAPSRRTAEPARPAADRPPRPGDAAAHPSRCRGLGARLRPRLPPALRPPPDGRRVRPRVARRRDARPARRLAAGADHQPGRRRDGPAAGAVQRRGRRLAAAAAHGHGRVRARPCARLLRVAATGGAAAAPALAGRGGARRRDPAAGGPDALHRRRHLGAGLRQGHQHPRGRRRRDPAPPRPGAAGDLPPRAQRRALLALVAAAARPGARRERGQDQPGDPRVRRPGAAATARRTAAARTADQPAGGDDRRRRPARQRRRRPRRGGQRADHAARRRGHHRQHAGVDDPPAAPASGGAAPARRRSAARGAGPAALHLRADGTARVPR